MKIVGNSIPIHDALGKARGSILYAGDMKLQNMAYASLVTSTIPHGRVLSFDTTKAMAVEGVIKIITCFNNDTKAYCRYRTIKNQEVVEQEYVFNDHVRFVGDKIACVIAESPQSARVATRLVEVVYEEYPHTFDIHESMAGKIDNVHAEGAVYGDLEVEVGDANQIGENCIETKTTSKIARISHVTMETHVAVADYNRDLGELTVWSPNQSVHGIRTVVAEIFSLPYHKVRVVKTTMGGSFGAKQEWMLEPVAAAASIAVDRPVSIVATREECFASTICRSPMEMQMTSHFEPDGKMKSMQADISMDAGGYLGNTYGYCLAMSNKFFRCYNYPHMKYAARAVITNTPVSGAFRGWTSPELNIAFEHNLNMVARSLDIDPYELRLKNVALPHEIDPRINVSLGEIRLKESLEKGAELFDWYKKKSDSIDFNQKNTRFKRGIAVACGGHLSGYYPKINDFAEVGLRMTEDGNVIASISLHDHGCGTVTAFQMIIAEALGLKIDNIYLKEADTATTPFDYGCFSSRTTYVLGKTACLCAEKLIDSIITATSKLHSLDKNQLYAENGFVKCKTDEKIAFSFADISFGSMNILKTELSVKHQHINESNPGVTGAHFAHVEIDCYTGMTKLLDYTAVHDIGQAINREMCVAQIQGSVIMGAGAAIYEELSVNDRGIPVKSLKDYHLINAFESPEITVEFIESPDSVGPFGAKSIGEVCHVPVASAVAGAINNALESSLADLPITPDKIVELMQQRSVPDEG